MSGSARLLARSRRSHPVETLIVVTCLLLAVGCTSKADRHYAKCLDLEKQNRLIEARGACTDAELDDPASSSGQKAHQKGRDLDKKLKEKRAEQDRAFEEHKKNR